MQKNTKKFYSFIALILIISIFLLYKNNKNTGNVYAPDMHYSQTIETYDKGFIKNWLGSNLTNIGALIAPKGTIAKNSLAHDTIFQKESSVVYSFRYTNYFKNTIEDKARAGNILHNPYTATEDILKKGESVYNTQCAICHGKTGLGDGLLIIREDGSDGAYKSVPPNFKDRLPLLKDGEIFHSITYGMNNMGGYAAHVKAEDRWKLICYIKKLAGLVEGNLNTEIKQIDSKSDSIK